MSKLTLVPGTEYRRVSDYNINSRGEKVPRTRAYAQYQCYCGNVKEMQCRLVESGRSKTCGCSIKEFQRKGTEASTTHGGKGTRLYKIWDGMKQRCHNPNCKDFKNYGSKGVSLCSAWLNDFVAFRDWALSNGYESHLTIDRINPDGNYEPSNCQWLTRGENSRKSNIQRKRG